MARLNEPSTQVESVEALKRRFVRQNREIARVNSTQSLRIRSLESEVSSLLSENITLREEVIRLQFQIDNNVGAESINVVREKLETKLGELGNLVQELGNLQQSAENRRAMRRRSGTKASPKKSPDQRNWKTALTISEVTSGADGRLPPIVEGKYYPRKTLEADELLRLLPDSGDPADSPDLGPPPIAHFEAGDPIEFDASQQESLRRVRPDNSEELNPALLANLETRRKRRESSQPAVTTTVEAINSRKDQQGHRNGASKPEHMVKSGAKRKFSAREEDEHREPLNASERDEFQYNRTQETPLPDHVHETKPAVKQAEKQVGQSSTIDIAKSKERSRDRPKANANPAPTSRSVLAPKSVNTDPVSSPVKVKRVAEGEKAAPLKPDVSSKSRDRSRARDKPASERFARPAKASQGEVFGPKIIAQNVPPPSKAPHETPGGLPLDSFSPDDSEPPAVRPDSRDTPPPADLDPKTANTNDFGSMGRASRRQKGSVSYAEPNLRDKMRRATKELVDAVGADDRLQQKKTIKTEGDANEAEPQVVGQALSKMRTVTIKKEPTADDAPDWRALPMTKSENDRDTARAEAPSPLNNKAPSMKADLPPSVVTERRRRPSMLERDKPSIEGGQQGFRSGSAIAALMTDNPKPRSRENNVHAGKPQGISKPAETPEVYDIRESSPAEAGNVTAKVREAKPAVTRSSRRHSSVSDDRIKDAMARRAERRKEAAVVPDLKNVRSAATLAVESGDGGQGRGERAASRRRSMML